MFSGILGFQLLPTRFTFQFVTVTFVFLIVNFIGGIGKFIGLTTNVRELNLNGEVKNIGRASIVDGGGTVLGAALGTSSLITYVESSVGIASGGVRGLTAIVCGTLMLSSLVVAPYIGLVPVEATAGVLVYAGMTLFPIKQIRSSDSGFGRFDIVAALLMGTLSAVFFGLDKAMLAGFILYSGRNLLGKDGQPKNWYLFSTTLLLFASVLLGWLQGR
jgi:AGZA family xanthine/uracil permease-like MFS transporter